MRHPFDSLNDMFNRGEGRTKDMMLTFGAQDEECVRKVRKIDQAVLRRAQASGWVRPGWDWHPSLKERAGGRYCNIKFKLPTVGPEREYLPLVQDGTTREELDLEEALTAGCTVQVIARPARVYVRKNQVGLLWEATSMRIREAERRRPPQFVDDGQ